MDADRLARIKVAPGTKGRYETRVKRVGRWGPWEPVHADVARELHAAFSPSMTHAFRQWRRMKYAPPSERKRGKS